MSNGWMKGAVWMLVAPLAAGGLAACGDMGGQGSLTVKVTGEDGAKTGLPVNDNGETIAFADGWTLTFSKYLVSLGNLSLTGADGAQAFVSTDTYVADLHAGDPEVARFDGLAARRWERFSFEVVPAVASAKNLNGVAQADLDRMVQGGFNLWLEGAASKNGKTYTFAWGLKNPTRNADCTNGDDGKQGLVVTNNSTTEAEITFHVEHLFWTSLGTENAALRFDPIAAMSDGNGQISFDALANQSLAQPRDAEGNPLKDESGQPLVYNPGSVPLSENNLKGFVLASSSSEGHLNGEGLCTISRK